MKVGENLAASLDGTIRVLLQDDFGALVREDYSDVQVKLALRVAGTADDGAKAVQLSQAGVVRDHVTACIEEGTAIFRDVTVTGKHTVSG